MATPTIEFFGPTCPFELAGWEFQTQNALQRSKDYISELGSRGDEILNALINGKTTCGWQFISTLNEGAISIPDVGQILGGYHIDSVEVSWDRSSAKPKLTMTGHAHDGIAGGHNTCRTYSSTLNVAATQFGIPSSVGPVSLGEAAVVDFRSIRYTLTCSHIDEQGRTGNQLKGENHDGVESLSIEFTGNYGAGEFTVAGGWANPSSSVSPSNTGATSSSLELVHHIQSNAA